MTSAKVPICKLARNITLPLLIIELIHTKVIRMLDGTQESLELDIHTATPADVQSFVDARYEAAWRATGVRVLRRDLPFLGPALRTSNHSVLNSAKTLAENGVSKHTTLHTYWPPGHGTRRDRERCEIRESRSEADERVAKRARRNEKKSLQEKVKLARQRVAQLAAEIAAAEEINVLGVRDSRVIDVHEDEGGEDGGPEQQERRPAEDNRAPQTEEGRRELVQRGTEGQVHSVPQSVEDPFLTSDQDKENWDPQIVPANLFWQARFSV